MNIVFVLIPLSLIFLCAGVWAFFWSVNHSQFDDLDTPALIPLCDDSPPQQNNPVVLDDGRDA